MIVLDTNLFSALMRSQPDKLVIAWLDAQPSVSIWTTSITCLDVLYGLRTMASVKRSSRSRGCDLRGHAAANGTLATRTIKHFAETGIALVNPREPPA